MSQRKKIEDLLSAESYNVYSALLALSDLTLIVVNPEGQILYEFIPLPDFCKYACQNKKDIICTDCRSMMAEKTDPEQHRTCSNGLKCILAEIRDGDETVAYVIGGFAYSTDMEYQKFMLATPQIAGQRGLDIGSVAKMCSALCTVEDKKIDTHYALCTYIAQDISRSLANNAWLSKERTQSIEKDFLEKKIIDLEAKNNSLMVNPHFLFNSLNCIARIAYFEGASKSEALIYTLSDLLRYNVRNTQSLHTIQAELDNIEKYLYIQKARFKSRLEYSIDVPEHIRVCRILNMILQPIVENAVNHGIAPQRTGGKIDIYAESRNKTITIYIADNGGGFSKEVLQRLNTNGDKEDGGMGFRITDKRIKQFYGKEYGLEIVRSDYSGSTVSITISKNMPGR